MEQFAFLHGGFAAVLIVFFIAVFAFEIAMFVHVIRNKSITSNTRILWVAGMLLLHPFVAIAYYFTDYKKSM